METVSSSETSVKLTDYTGDDETVSSSETSINLTTRVVMETVSSSETSVNPTDYMGGDGDSKLLRNVGKSNRLHEW
jgi:hypothetical protein